MSDKTKLSTESYKGVRDFYPEDLFIQNYIFNTWKEVVEKFGYVEYSASLLESAELYRAKSGEEIVNEQTYTFTDRGDREVTLRPEMTPTVARLVAAKENELAFPLRWYSIPNLFRYEKPQRGRLREHWQLNVDLFGVENRSADTEIITVGYEIMKKFGAKDTDFSIKINNRKIVNALYGKFGLNPENSNKASKVIDKKAKMSPDGFETALEELLNDKTKDFISLLESDEKLLEYIGIENPDVKDLVATIDELLSAGIENIVFDPTLMRGFDYYTGMVFEVFDLSPENNRSLFGGGRYDDLTSLFGEKKIPAVGFGEGDVTMKDFLETHELLPKYKPSTDLYICLLGDEFRSKGNEIAKKLREKGVNVAVDLSQKKLGEQIKIADRQKIPFIICVGENEINSGIYPLKNMLTGVESKIKIEEVSAIIRNHS
ncbi:MAG: histidine--tRNA ligase [Candidatus Zambryskibacteria bacterium]|nr:histidine--tRNA ligase [Candidatus Zambryskibacteria bacterium]